MDTIEILFAASSTLNLFILGAVLTSCYRIGRIEGSLKKNGTADYLKCPFYKVKVDDAVRETDAYHKC